MHNLKYPIHGAPGITWTLVFDLPTSFWCVEEFQTERGSRERTPLDEFKCSENGAKLAHWLNEAAKKARAD
jgi:hypothetical protein